MPNKRRFKVLAGALTIAALLSSHGCGSSGSTDSAGTSGKNTETAAPVKPQAQSTMDEDASRDPKASVVWTYATDRPDVFMRAAVKVSNPADQPRTGVVVQWKAKDSDGVIVGSFRHEVPLIEAESDVVYVAGAGGGHLTGAVDSVDVDVLKSGKLADADESLPVKISKTSFEKQEYSIFEDADTYIGSAVITASEDIETQDFSVAVVLRDDNNEIVGVGYGDGFDLPDEIAAGEKYKITSDVQVPSDAGEPTEIEAWIS